MTSAAASPGRRLKPVPNETKLHAPRKLDIACGQRKIAGFKGIDLAGDADIHHDLFTYPWPIKTGAVREVQCHHFVEHIPHYMPEYGGMDGWWMFFSELYRICRKDASVVISHPFAQSTRADWDPTHTRRVADTTWYYLDKNWREMNQIDHYGANVDFEVVTIDGTGVPDEISARNETQQTYARTYYWNVIADLVVTLRVRK